jgi:hypothetical protein
MSGEYISVSNGKRPVSNVKKRAKMFAVCAWMQIAVIHLLLSETNFSPRICMVEISSLGAGWIFSYS